MVRREECACGGVIVVPVNGTADAVSRIVSAHNQTARHSNWRLAREGRELRWVPILAR